MPLSRRQIYRRRRATVFGGLGVVLVAAFYLPFTLLSPMPAARAALEPAPVPTSTAASVAWPEYGASAIGAVGFDGILSSSGSTEQLPMASISKIITALVVLDAKPLALDESGPDIAFTQADVDLYSHYLALNGSLAPVSAGTTFTELQVLQLMLIPSANNYAASLVNWAFGSQDAFVPIAQAWLAAHGLHATTMVEPTGIDPGNTSTASDLVELGKLAIANPVVAQITSTDKVKVPYIGTIENTNALLGHDGVTGLKTGTLEKSGANLLFSAEKTVGSQTVTVVGAVLGADDHDVLDDDIRTALDGVASGFQEITLATEGTEYGTVTTAWGDSSPVVAAVTETTLVWSDTPITVVEKTTPVTTAQPGTDVGELDFMVGEQSFAVDLEVTEPITDPGPGWRLTHPFELG